MVSTIQKRITNSFPWLVVAQSSLFVFFLWFSVTIEKFYYNDFTQQMIIKKKLWK